MPTVVTAPLHTFSATAKDVVDRVRNVTNDSDTGGLRDADTDLLRWIGDALKEICLLFPRLFAVNAVHTCTAGFSQTLDFPRAAGVVDVLGVPVADFATLTQFSPGWQNSTPGAIRNWSTGNNDPLSFYVYPPAVAGATLDLICIQAPGETTSLTDVLPVPEQFLPAIAQYCIALSQSKDDEHVLSQRAAQAKADFIAQIKGA